MGANRLRWLLLAGVIHITLTLAIFLVGHFQLLPALIDVQGNVGTALSLPVDAASYRNLASDLAAKLQTNGPSAWLASKAPLHCRFYSLLFATVGQLLGHNILAAEPLNLIYYLAILVCVYLLANELFDLRVALLAAIVTGAWPSFLVVSTQVLRDSLSVLCLLALLLLLTLLLTRELRWRAGVVGGVAGAFLVTFFWVLRGNMWNVVILAVGIAIVLLSWRTIRARRFFTGNAIAIATDMMIGNRNVQNSASGSRSSSSRAMAALTPRWIAPVTTVPRPLIENTSSIGIKNGWSTRRGGVGM
jgi:hypothetical protein